MKLLNNINRMRTAGSYHKCRYLLVVFLQLITVIVAMFAFIWFRSANRERIVGQNKNYIEDCTIQEA